MIPEMIPGTFPLTITVRAKEFYRKGRYGIVDALADCLQSGYRPLFMPEIADAKIAAPRDGYKKIWRINWYTPSLMVVGRGKRSNVSGKGGTKFALYVHAPNHFSDPEKIKAAIDAGLVNGFGKVPEEEFQRYLDMVGDKSVFAVGCNHLLKSESALFNLRDALRHPQTIPLLGGKKRAESYLEAHEEVIGETIHIWRPDDSFLESLEDQPLGSLLFIGGLHEHPVGGHRGIGGVSLEGVGRFAGIRKGI